MHGEFDKLDAEAIEIEVEEYWREVFRLQKVFAMRLKKMRMEADERGREKKERRRRRELGSGAGGGGGGGGGVAAHDDDDEDEEVKPPAAIQTVAVILERLRKFKVRGTLFSEREGVVVVAVAQWQTV